MVKINKKTKKNIALIFIFASLFFLLFIPSIPSILAEEVNYLGTIKENSCIEIPQVCASCSYINLSVQYPNKSIAVLNQPMTYQGAGLWTYTFCNTSDLGRYDISGIGDINGVDTSFDILYFDVTINGKPEPSGFLIAFFILLLIALLSGLLTTLFLTFVGTSTQKIYLVDVIMSIGVYIFLILYKYLSTIFFPYHVIDTLLTVLMKVGVWTHVFIPLVLFFIFLILNYRRYISETRNSDGYIQTSRFKLE
jgi:hypothetical protein